MKRKEQQNINSNPSPADKARGLLSFVFFLTLLVLPHQAFSQTTAPITEVDIFAQGNIPATNTSLNVTNGGVPAAITPNPWPGSGSFTSSRVALPGNPGTVSVVFNISYLTILGGTGGTGGIGTIGGIGGGTTTTSGITVTITTNINTGAVTVSGIDTESPGTLGSVATLTVDGSTTTAPIASGSSFTVAGTGTIDDRTVNSCVAFASGMRLCSYVFGLNTDPVPPTPTAAAKAARDIAQDNAFDANYIAAIRSMTAHFSDIMLYQLSIIGMLLDSKHQLETQRLFGETAAQAHRDYHPSEEICAVGTLARSTAGAAFRAGDNRSILNLILQKRELLGSNMASSWGPYSDKITRLNRYKTIYCDPSDNNGFIGTSNICTAPDSTRRNKDVDYRRTLSDKMTVDVDFTDGIITPDEEDIIALANNLYSDKTPQVIPETALRTLEDSSPPRELMASRSLSAVRSVAYNSYSAIATMKSSGSGLNAAQLQQVMQNLGVPAGDVAAFIGDNPSYFAQMEIISQKMYQDPAFYSNLYNNPANVLRMKVVMQAIRLMVDRDKFEEALRREMLISMLLEMRLRQAETANNLEINKASRGP